jgi:hypothetical protein
VSTTIRHGFAARTIAACIVAVVALAPGALHAQSQAPARPRFGALLGASIATISDADFAGETGVDGGTVEAKRRIGFQLGAYLTYPLSANMSLEPELHYIQKGTTVQANVTDIQGVGSVQGEVAIRLAYVEVPLLVRVDMGGRTLRPFFVAGPSVAYRLSCTVDVAAAGLSFGTDCDQNDNDPTTTDDPFRKVDVGGIIGLGVASTRVGHSLSAQVRYSRGLVSIARESSNNMSPRNTGFSILFGFGF